MRYILSLVLALLIFSFSDSKKSHNSYKDTTSKVSNNLTTPPKADSFLMKYNFQKGDIYKYKIKTLSSSSQELLSDSTINTNARQTIEYKVKLSVESITPQKIAQINVFIESIFVDGVVNGQPITYNSNYIQSSQEKMMFAQYESIKKKTFTIDITEHGEIINIYNTNEIVNELLSIQKQSQNVTSAQKTELANNFSTSALRPLSEQIFRKFPTKKVSTNYTWSESYFSQFALFQIENIANYQVSGVKMEKNDSLIIVSAGLSINFIGEHKATEKGMSFYFYDPVISGNGTIKFNKTKGLVVYSETSTNMEMVTDIDGVDENGKQFHAKRTDNTSNTNIVELIK